MRKLSENWNNTCCLSAAESILCFNVIYWPSYILARFRVVVIIALLRLDLWSHVVAETGPDRQRAKVSSLTGATGINVRYVI